MGTATMSFSDYEPVPEIIDIQEIHHTFNGAIPKTGAASRLSLIHKGFEPEPVLGIRNGVPYLVSGEYPRLFLSDYSAELYVNGENKHVFLLTLNGHEFIPTHHYKVHTIEGDGVSDYYWDPGETAVFDFINSLINENDVVTLEIIRKSDGKVISRSTEIAPKIVRS
ncbi:hypothetical protein [Methanorbis rubei]